MNLMMITTIFWTLITPEVDLHMGNLLIGAFTCSLSIYLAGESPATQMVNRMLVMTPSLACSVGLVNMKGYLAHIQEDVLSLLWGNSPR